MVVNDLILMEVWNGDIRKFKVKCFGIFIIGISCRFFGVYSKNFFWVLFE